MDSLERLQGLHADLIAVSQRTLVNIDRLWHDLEASIEDFRSLLDKTQSTADEARAFREGKIEVDGQEFGINDEFRHLSSAIGTTLEISEEHAGKLIIQTQASGITDEQAAVAEIVRRYHDRRDYLLQDLRLILEQSLDYDHDDIVRENFQKVVKETLYPQSQASSTPGSLNTSSFAEKCLQTMSNVEAWQAKVNNGIQSKAILGQDRGPAFYLTLEFQRSSLFKQHECLGAILALLFRGNHTTPDNLHALWAKSQQWLRPDFSWNHYLPAFSSAFHQYGSPDGSLPAQETHQINQRLFSATPSPDSPNSPYRPLQAILEMWWTAQYSGQYRDNAAPDPASEARAKVMEKALDDGGLEFMISLSTHMRSEPWHHSTRQELVDMLLDGNNIIFDGIEPTSPYFLTMMMESYESFAESWITNMPDSIRKLKKDEDDKRLLQITAITDAPLQPPPREQGIRLHLESFLVVIACAFEDRPEAAEQFWDDPDSNLYGFVQWASRRQTVPRVSAFCEMLCAISQSADNAQAAHKFLLEDAIAVPNVRGKKLPSMNYQQIFAELDFYARKVHEKVQISQTTKTRQNVDPEINEAESPVMLACYLRLLSHLARHSQSSRQYLLSLPDLDLPKALLVLSSGPIPSYLRAEIFLFLEALLTEKTLQTSDKIWIAIEEWATTNHDRASATSGGQQTAPTVSALQNTLVALSNPADQYDAFVRLLLGLSRPFPRLPGIDDQILLFPPDLGDKYRFPGITPYVDFVCGQLTTRTVRAWFEDGSMQGVLRCSNCIDFMIAGLRSFNEHEVTALNRPSAGPAGDDSYAAMYLQRHQFSRIMQWIFSSNLNKCLMDLAHQPVDMIVAATPTDPKVINLERVIELLNLVLNLQPTYFDIVKPRAKSTDGYRNVQFSGMTAIEDGIIAKPEILLDLCQYAASEHVQLSLQSLQFLQGLSASARFQNHLFDETKLDRRGRQMIDMIGPTGEIRLQHISSTLKPYFEIDVRALEMGSTSDDYALKSGMLAFFNACLATQSASPNIAHLLLGFRRTGSRLVAGPNLEQGNSMFDALVDLTNEYPDAQQEVLLSWLIHIRSESIGVLKHLWSFPVSSDLTMTQLRRSRFLTTQFCNLSVVAQSSLWDGQSIVEPEFYFLSSADAFTDFLTYRAHLFDYVTREIHAVAKADIKALQEQYLSTLQGKSPNLDGRPTNHATIYDLFDFVDLDASAPPSLAQPPLTYFHDIDFDAYQKDELYDVSRIMVHLAHRSEQLEKDAVKEGKSLDRSAVDAEADGMCELLEARNRCISAQAERLQTLRCYIDMVVAVIERLPMESSTKTQFTLHMLQLFLPKLDTYLADGTPEAVELTRAADSLLGALSINSATSSQSRIDLTIAEKLFQLFRISAEGIPLSMSNPDLRGVLYSICNQFLVRILTSQISEVESSRKARTNAMDTIRSLGSQLINILSDDADDGIDICRFNALNLLANLVSLARNQQSNLIIEQFVKMNILEVLLEPIKTIAEEFTMTDPKSMYDIPSSRAACSNQVNTDRPSLLILHTTRITTLLQVSRSKPGAAALLDSNLIQSLHESTLFGADPDLGFDLNNTSSSLSRTTVNAPQAAANIKNALTTYFTLLSHLLRLLLSTFLSYGTENQRITTLIRSFLSEYRGNMVGVFKRAAGIQGAFSTTVPGIGGKELENLIEECLRCYTGLVVGSDFLAFEEERGLGGNGIGGGMLSRQSFVGGFT